MKVVMVGRQYNTKIWYSWHLCRYLSELIRLFFYGPKDESWSYRPGNTIVKQIWSYSLYPLQIFKNILKDKPDVIHFQFELITFESPYKAILMIPTLLLMKIAGVKNVITIHSIFPLEEKDNRILNDLSTKKLPNIVIKTSLVIFYKIIEILSDKIIVHANVFKKWLIEYYKFSESKIHVISHGVEYSPPKLDASKIKLWKKKVGNGPIVLYHGVLSPRKGVEHLIKSFSHVKSKAKLVIAGHESSYYNNYMEKIQRLTKSLKIEKRIVFISHFLKDEDIHALFKISDVVVFPYTYSISASGAFAPAVTYRKPIITTRTPFFYEILKDQENALIVELKEPKNLSSAIDKLIKNKRFRSKLSKNIKLKAKEWSWENVAKETFDLYKVIV